MSKMTQIDASARNRRVFSLSIALFLAASLFPQMTSPSLAEQTNLDFGSSSGWRITNGSSSNNADKNTAVKKTESRPARPLQTKWTPINPNLLNGNSASVTSAGSGGTSLMLTTPKKKSGPIVSQPVPDDKSNIGEQVSQLLKDGNVEKATSYLWDMRWQAKGDKDQEKVIDSYLLQLGDEKALTSSMILAQATDNALISGMQNLQNLGRYNDAIKLAKELERRRPKDASLFKTIAYMDVQTQNYNDAITEYRKADELDPKSPQNLNNIMYCYTHTGALEELQAARQEFVRRFPDDPNAADMQKKIDYYNQDFAQIRDREKEREASKLGLNTMKSGASDEPHFSNNAMPLKVYVEDIGSASKDWASPADSNIDYSDIIRKACDDWSSATRGKVSFTLTQNLDEANIRIEWIDDATNLVHSSVSGQTSIEVTTRRRKRHKIQLLAPTKSNGVNSNSLQLTATHEIGHALGLSHSSSPGDIMYFSSGGGSRSISENDSQRIIDLYGPGN